MFKSNNLIAVSAGELTSFGELLTTLVGAAF
jgi:hypothetical protein